MKITLLDREAIGLDTPLDVLYRLDESLTVYDRTSPEQLVERIADSEVIIINKIKVTRDVLQQCKSLRLICVFATGYDNIDVNSARELGIAVCNAPAYSTASVTAITVATVLNLMTHIRAYSDFVKSGEYSLSGLANRLTPVFHDLSGKVWGIIGCGSIGSSVAAVAEALGSSVITHQRHQHAKYPTVALDELCKRSDIITVHCPLNDTSREIINSDRLDLMKNSVVLVNSARGAVLDESAVADAVMSGKIGAFGCDVYSIEPFDTDHPYNKIRNLENVLLTPHCAWGSYEARESCIKIISENIHLYFNGKIKNRVDI